MQRADGYRALIEDLRSGNRLDDRFDAKHFSLGAEDAINAYTSDFSADLDEQHTEVLEIGISSLETLSGAELLAAHESIRHAVNTKLRAGNGELNRLRFLKVAPPAMNEDGKSVVGAIISYGRNTPLETVTSYEYAPWTDENQWPSNDGRVLNCVPGPDPTPADVVITNQINRRIFGHFQFDAGDDTPDRIVAPLGPIAAYPGSSPSGVVPFWLSGAVRYFEPAGFPSSSSSYQLGTQCDREYDDQNVGQYRIHTVCGTISAGTRYDHCLTPGRQRYYENEFIEIGNTAAKGAMYNAFPYRRFGKNWLIGGLLKGTIIGSTNNISERARYHAAAWIFARSPYPDLEVYEELIP